MAGPKLRARYRKPVPAVHVFRAIRTIRGNSCLYPTTVNTAFAEVDVWPISSSTSTST